MAGPALNFRERQLPSFSSLSSLAHNQELLHPIAFLQWAEEDFHMLSLFVDPPNRLVGVFCLWATVNNPAIDSNNLGPCHF